MSAPADVRAFAGRAAAVAAVVAAALLVLSFVWPSLSPIGLWALCAVPLVRDLALLLVAPPPIRLLAVASALALLLAATAALTLR